MYFYQMPCSFASSSLFSVILALIQLEYMIKVPYVVFLLIFGGNVLILDLFGNSYRVEDAVIRYLNRKPVAGSDAPGSM